ncbi:hypothetical protein GGTG_07235 [Gaeumannomyces tritici R3-111a-1]|uniref:Heterokaryon incompatibility domain-containing protein n=1 Tax=Gaeumannomyces tritici (strain R3-111a-1) TaxID=644352 RepID=J3P138_GAET3|nr:hypothetical protein GGTG_07235 [Gaeumannomyces tritici R3-111a-1]EJT77323.1 hypothetical protein GGTG_07235 [Gaeumannomyces tritici R3-111a-1]
MDEARTILSSAAYGSYGILPIRATRTIEPHAPSQPPPWPQGNALGDRLCPTCAQIDMEHLRQLDSRSNHGGTLLTHGLGGISKNYQTCDLCRVMDQAIKDFRESGLRPLLDFPPKRLMGLYSSFPHNSRVLLRLRGVNGDGFTWFGDEAWRRASTCNSRNPGFAIEILVELPSDPSRPEFLLAGIMSLYLRNPDPEDEISHVVPNRAPAAPDSEETMRAIRSWLDVCTSNHEACKKKNYQAPIRLIEISPDGSNVRLVESRSLQEPFCALSYCWGDTKFLSTTSSNYQSLLQRIPVDKLCLSIQQAIDVTRRVGQKYLWVDALCIVQDDKNDWKRHILIMGSIYASATLTIAAASASSGEEGCYAQRPKIVANKVVSSPFEARVPCVFSGRYLGDMFAIPFHRRHGGMHTGVDTRKSNLYADLQNSRWESRAWVFQERFFSRRIVYFANSQVYWQCQTFMAGQNFPWLESMMGRGIKDRDNRWKGLKHLKRTWRVFLESYTRSGISYPSDRLPALTSIAREAEQVYGHGYVAGLFVDTFPQSLLWIANNLEQRLQAPKGVSSLERASSWSWAHWEGPIKPDAIPHRPTSSHLGTKDIRILKFGHDDSHHRSALIFSSSMTKATRSQFASALSEFQMLNHKGGYRYGFSVEKSECHSILGSRGFIIFDDPDSAPMACELLHIGHVPLNSPSTLRGRTKGKVGISLAVELVERPPELQGQCLELPCYRRLGVAYQITGHDESTAVATPTPHQEIILV